MATAYVTPIVSRPYGPTKNAVSSGTPIHAKSLMACWFT